MISTGISLDLKGKRDIPVPPESAFPLADHGEVLADGLNKRELFAAMAMQGLISQGKQSPKQIAEVSVCYADALIARLQS